MDSVKPIQPNRPKRITVLSIYLVLVCGFGLAQQLFESLSGAAPFELLDGIGMICNGVAVVCAIQFFLGFGNPSRKIYLGSEILRVLASIIIIYLDKGLITRYMARVNDLPKDFPVSKEVFLQGTLVGTYVLTGLMIFLFGFILFSKKSNKYFKKFEEYKKEA